MEPAPGATHPDDLRLAQAALDGDPAARADFAQRMRCVPRILAAMNRRRNGLLTPQDIEDLSQDTLVTIWRRLHTYEGRAALETWAYRFCSFQLSNRLQLLRNRPVHHEVEPHDAVEETIHACEEFEGVQRILDRLEPEIADLIRLKLYEQWSFEELAERFGASSNTLKARYYRGLTRLGTLLEPGREEVER